MPVNKKEVYDESMFGHGKWTVLTVYSALSSLYDPSKRFTYYMSPFNLSHREHLKVKYLAQGYIEMLNAWAGIRTHNLLFERWPHSLAAQSYFSIRSLSVSWSTPVLFLNTSSMFTYCLALVSKTCHTHPELPWVYLFKHKYFYTHYIPL